MSRQRLGQLLGSLLVLAAVLTGLTGTSALAGSGSVQTNDVVWGAGDVVWGVGTPR